MFAFTGARHRFCDGLSRRNFLALGAFGTTLTLADLLRSRAAAKEPSLARPKSAIMIYLPGGPSHLDMYDPKPNAPEEIRGEFKAIPTTVPGVQICEHFPQQAKIFDKLAIVRSLISVDEHSDSYVMTGYREQVNRTAGHPSFGAVMAKLRSGTADVPPFVSLRGMSLGTEPGHLGIAYRPFTPDGPALANLRLPRNVDAQRVAERKSLLEAFDTARRDVDASGAMSGMDAFTQRAFDMIASGTVRTALNLENEDPKSRERYRGVERFLTARRLVEAGVGCVTLSYGGWDTHTGNFRQLKRQLPDLDRGIANLVTDLSDRGLLEDVVIVVWGEFGRTPKINRNDGGRDHWAPVMSALVAGGGLKMGQVVGSSTARGEQPKDRPYRVPQLLSTLYRAMGIDPALTFRDGSGRPVHILDDREPVRELL